MHTAEREKSLSDVRVGILTFTGFCILVLAVTFAGGDKGLLLKKTCSISAHLADIGGLKKGSTVTMGGMSVGKVTRITMIPSPEKCPIEITMQIRADVRPRIKENSVPTVKTQGMLGDRYIEISMGTDDSPALAEGRTLTGRPASDFDETMREARTTLSETNKLLGAINGQQGTVGQFLYDREFYEQLTEITNQLNDLIKDFKLHPRKYIKFSVF